MAQARGGGAHALSPALPPRRPRAALTTPFPPARPAQPSEIGPAFVLLASGESSYITGHTIHIDVGMFLGS
jgi:NAD(P)-dependent dehydrogenase (short-subunit alcohol dehydrogenase family)